MSLAYQVQARNIIMNNVIQNDDSRRGTQTTEMYRGSQMDDVSNLLSSPSVMSKKTLSSVKDLKLEKFNTSNFNKVQLATKQV